MVKFIHFGTSQLEPYAAPAMPPVFFATPPPLKKCRRTAHRRRHFRGQCAAVKVSDMVQNIGENLHAACNFWYVSVSLSHL